MKHRILLALILSIGLLSSSVKAYEEEGYEDEGGYEDNYEEGEVDEGGYEEESHTPLPSFGHSSDVPNMLSFETLSEQEHMRNFKKISNDVNQYEEEYANCIKEISDHEYTEMRIEECVGRNFIKVVLDIKYITLKIISRADTKVRKLFIESCYIPAGTVEEFSIGCDLMERDALDLMWKGLDFVKMLEVNKEKYIKEYSKVPYDDFRDIIDHLSDFAKEFFELLDEVDSHKEVTILRVKTLIDDRTKLIVEEAKNNPQIVLPPEIKHKIEITEEIIDPNAISIENLPPPQILNSNPKDFGIQERKARALAMQPHPRAVPQLTTKTPYRPVQRQQIQVKGGQIPRRALYSSNHYRMFNSAQRYGGLNTPMHGLQPARSSAVRVGGRTPGSRVRSLRSSERIGNVKFRSVHGAPSRRTSLSRRFK